MTFGGVDYPNGHIQVRDSTWTFKGGAWLQLHPAHVPPARDTAVLVFDAARRVIVMYGGSDVPAAASAGRGGVNTTFAADTWTWDGSDWMQQHPAHHPVLFVPYATYDYARNEVVLLGFGSTGMETWTYDGADWVQHPAVHGQPDPPRVQGWLSFDPASKTVVTFGGFNQGGADLTAVWEWDGQTWTRTRAAGPAVDNRGSIMAPDVDRASTLLYNSDGKGAATWRWDGSSFQQLQPSHLPHMPALALTADPPRHRLLLFGWTWPDHQFQVWSWSGGDWSLVDI